MPLEVSEIGIAMHVSDEGRERGGTEAPNAEGAEASREELIQECVRRVLRALKAEREP